MDYKIMLRLQKCLFINVYLSITWIFVIAFFLYMKLDLLGSLTKSLSLVVFTLFIIIESTRIYLGHYGNLSRKVPELAGFLMLTLLMQMPLMSFFLFNPYLMSTPTELSLHIMLFSLSITEVVFGFMALNEASLLAKSIYLSRIRGR